MLKKILAAAVTAATLTTCSVAGVPVQASTADPTIKHLGKTTQQDGVLTLYNYNVSADTKAAIKIEDSNGKETTYNFADFYNHPQTYNLGKGIFSSSTWVTMGSGGGGGSAPSINLENSGGKYEYVKIKLSDFSSYFNTDGSHTEKENYVGNHKYKFREEEADANGNRFTSVLLIYSGGAVNHVVPDKDGMVKIYISTKPGDSVRYATTFNHIIHHDGSVSYGGGGGTSGSYIGGLSIGDADMNGYTSISDVTAVQRYSAKMEDFNSAQIRCGDLNGDGDVNIVDATLIQKALAE